MYGYGWFSLLCSRNQCNIVKYSLIKNEKRKENQITLVNWLKEKIILFYICISLSSNPCIIIILYVSFEAFFLNNAASFLDSYLPGPCGPGHVYGSSTEKEKPVCTTQQVQNIQQNITKPFWVALKRKQGGMWVHQAFSCYWTWNM